MDHRSWLAASRATRQQRAAIVDEDKRVEIGRTPHELEGDARLELAVRHVVRAPSTRVQLTGRPRAACAEFGH